MIRYVVGAWLSGSWQVLDSMAHDGKQRLSQCYDNKADAIALAQWLNTDHMCRGL